MGLSAIPLDMMTITIAAIRGIAVDNTIHYIFRHKIETRVIPISNDQYAYKYYYAYIIQLLQ